jgi:Tol biopolymer transport system component
VYAQRVEAPTPERITQFTEGHVTSHRWSPDGSRLAVIHQVGSDDNVWVTAADGSRPKRLTDFTGLTVYEVRWTPDSRRVILRAGTESNDAVLIRNFR